MENTNVVWLFKNIITSIKCYIIIIVHSVYIKVKMNFKTFFMLYKSFTYIQMYNYWQESINHLTTYPV